MPARRRIRALPLGSMIAPRIKIEVTDDGIAVTDNGPGIPAKTVEAILDYD
jgi:signal transduction histidine kinase